MHGIAFVRFEQVDPDALIRVLNEDSVRTHLVHHPCFDIQGVQAWMEDKIRVDGLRGCRVRVVLIDGKLAGWCGIQPDEAGFEIAIVISRDFWGYGLPIFRTLMLWADELGHKEVVFHLLDTRREYRALARMARRVCQTQLLGRKFTTYYFTVPGTA